MNEDLKQIVELRALLSSTIIMAKLFDAKANFMAPLGNEELGVKITPAIAGICAAVENVADLADHSNEVREFLAAQVDVNPDELTSRRLLGGAIELTRLMMENPTGLPPNLYSALEAHFAEFAKDPDDPTTEHEVPFGALTCSIQHWCTGKNIDLGLIERSSVIQRGPGLGLLIENMVPSGTTRWRCPFCNFTAKLRWLRQNQTTEGECSYSPEK